MDRMAAGAEPSSVDDPALTESRYCIAASI
eukprot:COSAG06_NODE_68403_length_228_cov_16.860465_1_plen_29_part_10